MKTDTRTLLKAGVYAGISSEFRGRRASVYQEEEGAKLYLEDLEPRNIPAEHLDNVLGKIVETGDKFHWGFVCNPMLPLANTFADLFTDDKKYTVSLRSPVFYNYRHVGVVPELARIVDDCTGLFGGVSFEIVAGEADKAWVYMKANQIIATRYVAQISLSSVKIP